MKLEVFEAYTGMYEYSQLPAYARYLLNNRVHEYASEQLDLSKKLAVPLLKTLTARYTEQEIVQLAISTSREYLEFIAANKGKEQIMQSMSRWTKDQLEIVAQGDVSAKDITLINYMREQALKKFLPEYTSDLQTILTINKEIDLLMLGAATTSTDIFIDLLRSKLAEQSNLASKLIEASPAITFLFDIIHNKQIFISGKVYEVLGFTSDELMQMGSNFFLQLIHPRDLEMMIEHIRTVLQLNQSKTTQVEFRFRHKDGQYRWLRSYEVIFSRDEEGRPQYVLGKTFEITAEKETALALQKRESQLVEAQSLAHIGNYEWNIVDQHSTNSEEVYRIFELQREQKYEEFISHVHPDDVQKVKDAVAEAFKSGQYECEYRYTKNDKEKVIWSVGKVEFRNDQPYRMVGTVQDVTQIKKMEKQLAQSNESLRQFAFVASHDMKEPLRKIMMFSDMVLSNTANKLTDKSVTQLQKMQSAGRNLYKMVEDILSFSLLEVKEEKEKTSLANIIAQVMEILEESINEKQAKIVYNGLPEAYVIPSQMKQLFQNLVANSLKFQRKGVAPEITITGIITAEPEIKLPANADSYLEMTVSDNGIGFPAEMQEKIFELFSRLYPKSEYEGTGLGLSISKRIVDNHGGAIQARSTAGSGATFIVVIPQ